MEQHRIYPNKWICFNKCSPSFFSQKLLNIDSLTSVLFINFTKRNNINSSLSVLEVAALRMGSTLQERIVFPGRDDPFAKKQKKKKIEELLHLKVFPLAFIVFIKNMLVVADLRLYTP